MAYVNRGNAAEVRTAELLQKEGWLVGSRRHIAGAGDLLAVRPVGHGLEVQGPTRPVCSVALIEVKKCENLWQNFRRPDRSALLELASTFNAEPLVAWWKPKASKPVWVYPTEYPSA
jgi:Holliday junction resolvase